MSEAARTFPRADEQNHRILRTNGTRPSSAPSPLQVIAKVEPLTSARALRGPFDYLLPARLDGVGVGSLLLVPFGPRRVPGVVVALTEQSDLPPDRLAEPVAALGAGVPPELVELALWTAREYCSTPSRGLQLVLPPGTGRRAKGPVRPRTELLVSATAAAAEALAGGERLGTKQRAVLELLAGAAQGENLTLGAELAAAEIGAADRATIRRLEDRGLVRTREVERSRRPVVTSVGEVRGPVRLTADQRRAVARITSAEGGRFLLHGVTGSGKTEVYLAAVDAALDRGEGAIVLVPEIGLTPQTVGRFRERFGDLVALTHSQLSAGERADEWRRLRTGAARICVGPRSAVFAPVEDLGLIVIDEEHDASYKQEGDPRYDARHVARRRAELSGATLVAGTATPRPETWVELEHIELPERVDSRPLPEVELLDMRERSGRAGALHDRTRAELERLRADGGKAIVLVNRRGYAPHLSCRSCGRAWGCPECDVSLVVHRRDGRLACHHCGHRERLPSDCPDCGSVSLSRFGAGSERIESEIAEVLAPIPVFRLDSDAAAGGEGHAGVLRRFQEAESAVLVGTQMVAKGHDFSDVTLSVVLDADASLRFPDFRAEERTFALVSQLAGRSGRGEAGGRVLVQTLAPDAASIAAASRHDSAGFVSGELERRRELAYPPFASLVRVELTAEAVADAERAAAALAARIEPALPEGAVLLGPAPRFRLRGRERRQLLVKSGKRAGAVAAVRDAVEAAASARELRGLQVSVDVDPQ
jgi:primosomal protein N' (replication factor Y)